MSTPAAAASNHVLRASISSTSSSSSSSLFASKQRLVSHAQGQRRRLQLRRSSSSSPTSTTTVAVVSSTLPGAVAGQGGGTCAEGAGVAVVGLGTRGSVVVDRLVAQGVLPLAEYWSLNSDTVSLQSAYAPNRWRLPPSSVDVSQQACRDNAVSAARGILAGGAGGVPPEVIVVLASAAEASGAGLETIKAIAELKDGPPPKKKWGFKGMVGSGRGGAEPLAAHSGPLIITAVVTPFDFEGPRKGTQTVEYLEAVQAAADLVTVVPQEALTKDGAGEALTVQEATEFADTTLQWSLWTLLEMLRRGCAYSFNAQEALNPGVNE